MSRYARLFHPFRTPQGEAATPDQVRNDAGGYVFELSDRARLERFLVLGSDAPTYYAKARTLTRDNARAVLRALDADPAGTVATIIEVSRSGRAPKQSPAIFALALAAAHPKDEARAAALAALPAVCRTGAHLFEFLAVVTELRGWGRGLRRAVCRWYTSKDVDALAYQVLKYRQRAGFSHRDALRLAGGAMGSRSEGHDALFRWITAGREALGEREVSRGETTSRYAAVNAAALPARIGAFEALQATRRPQRAAALVRENGLTHEMVPAELQSSRKVWDALRVDMPMTAMLRNLGRMTSYGVLTQGSEGTRAVVARLRDGARLQKARVHPLGVLVALNTYRSGKGVRGSLTWKPVPQIVAALEEAFDLAFHGVEPTGKRLCLALDVSGSMGFSEIAGMTGITPRVGSAAMALTTMRTEEAWSICAFASELRPVTLHPRMALSEVIDRVSGLPFGGTDCAKPMQWALQQRLPFDGFVVYTDNETCAGREHPFEALARYRQAMGIPAKLIVVGMTATRFSIAKQDDPGMLDVVGFDAAAPRFMARFLRE